MAIKKTTGMSAKKRRNPATRMSALNVEEANKIIATVALKGDGDVAWIDYENGPYLTAPIVDFSKGQEIVFDDPEWNVASLVNITTYALLTLRKKDDGQLLQCYIKTPNWW